MLTMQKNTTAKLRGAKQLSLIFFLAAMIFVWYCISVYISVSAQNIISEISACYESDQARYTCFIKKREGEFARAKEMEAFRRSVRETKEELLLESNQRSKKQLEKNHRELMKQIKYSKSRNISHKGEKYSITYGYVVELKP